jgi:hypothetical protein
VAADLPASPVQPALADEVSTAPVATLIDGLFADRSFSPD